MEHNLALKHRQLAAAVDGFATLLQADLLPYSEVIVDGLRNGQIQKFEYCVELSWKVARAFLATHHGSEAPSPKSAAKALFRVGAIGVDLYESFIEMIDARNETSHLYVPAVFERIHAQLARFRSVLSALVEALAPQDGTG